MEPMFSYFKPLRLQVDTYFMLIGNQATSLGKDLRNHSQVEQVYDKDNLDY